ncbi:MAG: PHP domain-containing protein, partial [Pseudomonadota bacterium]
MPDPSLTPDKRTLDPDQGFTKNPPAPFVELGVTSCFSFLRGASDAVDLVTTAWTMGYDRIGIADRNSMAGVVRIHAEAKVAAMRPVIGTRLVLTCGAAFLAYPKDRAAYGTLCA